MIELPFPSPELAGHGSKHFWRLRPIIAEHREWAKAATWDAFGGVREARGRFAGNGDIAVRVHFVPANNRGDRLNYPNRMKPYFDGIADALGINDKRFVPTYSFAEPEKPGRVEVTFG